MEHPKDQGMATGSTSKLSNATSSNVKQDRTPSSIELRNIKLKNHILKNIGLERIDLEKVDLKNIEACIEDLMVAQKEAKTVYDLAAGHIERLKNLRTAATTNPQPNGDRYHRIYMPYQQNMPAFSSMSASVAEQAKTLHILHAGQDQ